MSEKQSHSVSVLDVEKDAGSGSLVNTADVHDVHDESPSEDQEVFKTTVDGENYRTVSWYRTFALMFKVLFSVGILSIPSVFSYVGALPGALLVIGWGAFNTYGGFLLGAFRLRHPGMHGLQDMAYLVGGPIYREVVGVLYVVGYTLVAGSGFIGVATALNALSDHGACTVWFAFVAFVGSTALASFPKLSQIGMAAWIGCATLFVSVGMLVIAVGVQGRPSLAPEGVTDFGYQVIGSPTFLTGMSASLIIFVSSSGTSSFVPIIAEMKNPREYKKPIAASMGLLNVCYIIVSLVVYKYCGIYIASPALGSAGVLIKKISYGIALPGLWISAVLSQHLAAKYVFVRLLRDTPHLQSKTTIHWVTWLGTTVALGIVAFVVAEAVPFFGTLIGLLAAIAYAPMAIVVPMHLWLWDFADHRKGTMVQKLTWGFHVIMLLVGLFMTVGGAYAMIKTIIMEYATGAVTSAFSCANNA
ncbi:transmembrane amino acid transporter protein-domain-containing protein [Papiliotrema laurentii]|uniref:Transmembrane amino acid transporter protein-domain-containing protein n=1 Tax=Papiliotrema laurentii TaxID=5418 RepID=A0AAD9FTR4_PAPLA|nr:transmembrane amino acid transporter protein-domain-containing protein [Papiliotrema laurentii]